MRFAPLLLRILANAYTTAEPDICCKRSYKVSASYELTQQCIQRRTLLCPCTSDWASCWFIDNCSAEMTSSTLT